VDDGAVELPLLLLAATFFLLSRFISILTRTPWRLDEFRLLHRAKVEANNSILDSAATTCQLDRWGDEGRVRRRCISVMLTAIPNPLPMVCHASVAAL
jgi:hypothetical protein